MYPQLKKARKNNSLTIKNRITSKYPVQNVLVHNLPENSLDVKRSLTTVLKLTLKRLCKTFTTNKMDDYIAIITENMQTKVSTLTMQHYLVSALNK